MVAHVVERGGPVKSRPATFLALPCPAVPSRALPCLAMPRLAPPPPLTAPVGFLALPCPAVPCRALPCLAMPRLAPPPPLTAPVGFLALPCLASPRRAMPRHRIYFAFNASSARCIGKNCVTPCDWIVSLSRFCEAGAPAWSTSAR